MPTRRCREAGGPGGGKQGDSLVTLRSPDVPSTGHGFVTRCLRDTFRGHANHSVESNTLKDA